VTACGVLVLPMAWVVACPIFLRRQRPRQAVTSAAGARSEPRPR